MRPHRSQLHSLNWLSFLRRRLKSCPPARPTCFYTGTPWRGPNRALPLPLAPLAHELSKVGGWSRTRSGVEISRSTKQPGRSGLGAGTRTAFHKQWDEVHYWSSSACGQNCTTAPGPSCMFWQLSSGRAPAKALIHNGPRPRQRCTAGSGNRTRMFCATTAPGPSCRSWIPRVPGPLF